MLSFGIKTTPANVNYDDILRVWREADTRENLRQLVNAGFTHVVLDPPSPYPGDVARWVTDELIIPTLDQAAR
jgi:hypothetical protein